MSESTLSNPCPSCGALIEGHFNYCPFCGHMVRTVCGNCHSILQEGWTWCPICGQRTTPSLSIPTRVLPGGMEGGGRGMGDAEDFNQRGVELYEAERYDESIEQFLQALALDPDNSLYHCNLAVAYGERGDTDLAFTEYQRALQLNPSDLTAHLNLGYAYNEQGDHNKARREWEKLIDIAPDSPEAEEARDNLRNMENV